MGKLKQLKERIIREAPDLITEVREIAKEMTGGKKSGNKNKKK